MKMTETKTLTDYLNELEACEEARKWVGDKTLEQAWQECERGDWMFWLYRRAKNYNFQTLSLAKGHCDNTVRHLMKDDECSKKAVDVAIAFGEGKATLDELNAALNAAADAAARKATQKATADICRKYLPIPVL